MKSPLRYSSSETLCNAFYHLKFTKLSVLTLMSQQLPTLPPPPPLIFIWSEFGGDKLFGNNNPGNISIGLLSTQNKIYILYSLEIYESVCLDKYDTPVLTIIIIIDNWVEQFRSLKHSNTLFWSETKMQFSI